MSDTLEGEELEPIILKKRVFEEAGGHGGAWKVAYADFVTAMMAFFLLLWLLNATTEEQMTGLSEYFAPTSISAESQGLGDVMQGLAVDVEGVLRSATSRPSVTVAIPTYGDEAKGEQEGEERESPQEVNVNPANASPVEEEEEELDEAMAELRQSVLENQSLKDLQDSVIFEDTPDGIRVQLLDRQGREMFEPGTDVMTGRAKRLLALISSIVVSLPHDLSITGHTGSDPPPNATESFGNWELSTRRAVASRAWMVDNGVNSDRIIHVEGRADSELLDRREPTSAINRRISIMIRRQRPNPAPPTDAGMVVSPGQTSVDASAGGQPPQPAEAGDGAAPPPLPPSEE